MHSKQTTHRIFHLTATVFYSIVGEKYIFKSRKHFRKWMTSVSFTSLTVYKCKYLLKVPQTGIVAFNSSLVVILQTQGLLIWVVSRVKPCYSGICFCLHIPSVHICYSRKSHKTIRQELRNKKAAFGNYGNRQTLQLHVL